MSYGGRRGLIRGILRLTVLPALFFAIFPAHADGPPSTEDLIRQLQSPPKSQMEFRGLAVTRPQPAKPADARPTVDLAVNFARGSAELTPDDELILDNLGHALNDARLAHSRFSIDGHTDATGSAAFNQRLSEKRAASVRQYLVDRFGIDGSLLEAHGYGFSRLLDPADPTSAVNRRVEIINMSAP